MTEQKLAVARELLGGGEHTMQQIAQTVGVGRATLYRHLALGRRAAASAPPADISAAPAPVTLAAVDHTTTAAMPTPAPGRRAKPRKSGARALSRRRRQRLVGERRLWLREPCPTCRAAPGARCSDHGFRKTRRPTTELHFARGWRQRSCPTCHAQPGEDCFTPRGRSASRPHTARLQRAVGELTRAGAWEELELCGANLATLSFSGSRRAGLSFSPIRLERLTNGELTEIETWSEQRSGDPLIEALKAPVVARFASFLGQPAIRATLTWILPEHRITITGTRGDEPFEETIR
jgi:Helix-turn-helix domain of resolvase